MAFAVSVMSTLLLSLPVAAMRPRARSIPASMERLALWVASLQMARRPSSSASGYGGFSNYQRRSTSTSSPWNRGGGFTAHPAESHRV